MLHAKIENVPKHNITIIIGDFNAKVDNNKNGFERINIVLELCMRMENISISVELSILSKEEHYFHKKT